jgi:hypothetical protein
MTSTRRSEDKLKAMMPHKIVSPIGSSTAHPMWQSIKAARALLAENAVSIPSRLGDAALGHASIVVGAVRYTELSVTNHVYNIPQEVVPPNYAVGMLYHQHEEAKREYDLRVIDNYTHKAVETILTKMYLDAVHEDYKTEFFTEELRYRCSFAELDGYLNIKFNKKTSKELAENESEMKQPWSATHPIEALFRRIDACRRFDPSIPEETVVCNTVDIICVNDGFEDSFKDWNNMRPEDQTWDDLKNHFGDADKACARLMALKKVTSPTTYPGSASSATAATVPTANPMDRMANMVEQLCILVTAANVAGTTSIATSGGTRTTPHPHVPRPTNPTGGCNPTTEEAVSMSYCWSHGFCQHQASHEQHTSATCARPRIGHQASATATNKMGGETRICNSWPRPTRGAACE